MCRDILRALEDLSSGQLWREWKNEKTVTDELLSVSSGSPSALGDVAKSLPAPGFPAHLNGRASSQHVGISGDCRAENGQVNSGALLLRTITSNGITGSGTKMPVSKEKNTLRDGQLEVPMGLLFPAYCF